MAQSQRPEFELKAGSIHAAVWRERIRREGRSWDDFSIRIQKVYRDPTDGQYRTTTYFRPDDLPKLALAANEAFAYVTLKRQMGASQGVDDGASNHTAAEQPKDEAS